MKDTFKIVAALTATCFVCAALISVAHHLSAAPIKAISELQEMRAILEVLPESADGAPLVAETKTNIVNGVEVEYFETATGYAIKALSKDGYAGEIQLMLGFSKDDEPKLWSYKVIAHNETPGLGSHITDKLPDNIKGRDAFNTNWKVTKDGGDIVPLTAATISSRAVVETIGHAAKTLRAIQEEHQSAPSDSFHKTTDL